MVLRLKTNIEANTDSTLASVVGWSGVLTESLVGDPLNFATVGTASALRMAVKGFAKADDLSSYVRLMKRLDASPTLSGIILNSDNLAVTLATDAAVLTVALDAVSQYNER
jgi:hypothetical protein